MKRVLQFALAAMILFAACSKEDLTPPPLIEEQDVQEATTVVENAADDGYITLEEARKDLESILADFTTLSKSGNGGFPARKIADGFTLKSTRPSLSKSTGVADTAKIHVFNFEDNSGFAIMSATTEMPSLLAITEGGNIDTNEVIYNSGLIMFLSGLEHKIMYGKPMLPSYSNVDPDTHFAKDSNGNTVVVDENKTLIRETGKLYNPVGGFCKVHWSQVHPYNVHCPKDTKGNSTKTGCVATACAQLMSIYKYPSSFNGYSFHWSDMISGKNTNDIARLMEQIGSEENTHMRYGVNESLARADSIPFTFENFGYSCGGTVKGYNKNEVVEELKNGFSVLIGGCCFRTEVKTMFGLKTSYLYSGGHLWLAHGLYTREQVWKTTRDVKYVGSTTKPEMDFHQEGTSVQTNDYIL